MPRFSWVNGPVTEREFKFMVPFLLERVGHPFRRSQFLLPDAAVQRGRMKRAQGCSFAIPQYLAGKRVIAGSYARTYHAPRLLRKMPSLPAENRDSYRLFPLRC